MSDAILTAVSRAKELGALEERERIIKALQGYMGWGNEDKPTNYDIYFSTAINIINDTP